MTELLEKIADYMAPEERAKYMVIRRDYMPVVEGEIVSANASSGEYELKVQKDDRSGLETKKFTCEAGIIIMKKGRHN
jgi:hypothetical protein